MDAGSAIVEAAREYKGASYRHQARGPHHFDCIGMPACVARNLGLRSKIDGSLIEIHDQANYRPTTNGRILFRELSKHLHRVPSLRDAREGDLLLFIISGIAHTAILTDEGRRMIHASRAHGKVVEHVLGKWAGKVRAIFWFDEVASQ